MNAFILILLGCSAAAQAQKGYGRFPCTRVNPNDGSFSPDPQRCTARALAETTPATAPIGDSQGDQITPIDPICSIQPDTGAYFCGITGAPCTIDANCDNGYCGFDRKCYGGFRQVCSGDDSNCGGLLYCTSFTRETIPSDTCGGLGAFCADDTQGSTELSDAENQEIFDQFCLSGYCNFNTAQCEDRRRVGQNCSSDPQFSCRAGLRCNENGRCERIATTTTTTTTTTTSSRSTTTTATTTTTSQTTTPAPTTTTTTTTTSRAAVTTISATAGASQRASEKRNFQRRNPNCAADFQLCLLSDKQGFECIDTQTDLEQCGGCAAAGGVDCTTLPGVEAVGCVAGICEVWACASDFVWDEALAACTLKM